MGTVVLSERRLAEYALVDCPFRVVLFHNNSNLMDLKLITWSYCIFWTNNNVHFAETASATPISKNTNKTILMHWPISIQMY